MNDQEHIIIESPNIRYKKFLNNNELPLLVIGFFRGLFPKPKKGFILYEVVSDKSGCNLYFDFDYYKRLKNTIDENYYSGKFSESNSENEWNKLKFKFDNFEEISSTFNTSDLLIYEIHI